MKKQNRNLRKKIIKAAQGVFAEKGFFKTAMSDIAGESGIAKGTVYLYFKNKSDLYVSSLDDHFGNAVQILADVEQENISAKEKLQEITSLLLNYMNRFKTFPLFGFDNLNHADRVTKGLKSMMRTRLKQMIQIIAKIIDDGVKNGEFSSVDPEKTSVYFLNTIRAVLFAKFFIPGMTVDKNIGLELFFNGLNKRR
jgi:AcrR family transcriptional regulator